MMSHFSREEWADFVRGVANSEISTDIGNHLAGGCLECKQSFETWSRVRTVTAAESNYAVPEDAVRMAKLAFEAKYPREEKDWILGKLVFDTSAQAVTVGVRAARVSPRQLVYEAEGMTVDLRFERQPGSARVSVVGQVLAKESQESFHGATVILWTEKGEPVLATKTSPFGEFQLEFEPEEHLRLSIEIRGRRLVRIPWPI